MSDFTPPTFRRHVTVRNSGVPNFYVQCALPWLLHFDSGSGVAPVSQMHASGTFLLSILGNYKLRIRIDLHGITCTSNFIKTHQRFWDWSLTDAQIWPSLWAFLFVVVRYAKKEKETPINSASTTVSNLTESSRLAVCRGESWPVGFYLSYQCLTKPPIQWIFQQKNAWHQTVVTTSNYN
jgi:hypothetical protein